MSAKDSHLLEKLSSERLSFFFADDSLNDILDWIGKETQTPLSGILAYLTDLADVNIVLIPSHEDKLYSTRRARRLRFPDAPDEVARGKDRPFPTIRVRRMKLRDALDELAKAYKYRWCIRDEAIVFQPHPTKQ